MGKKKIPKTESICQDCEKIKQFSFKGCASTCLKFISHSQKILISGVSPCQDLRCRVPGVSPRKREVCADCPLPKIYSDSLGDGPECVLGKNREYRVFKTPWELARGR